MVRRNTRPPGFWLDTLVDSLMVSRVEPHLVNLDKRLVKSLKVCVRESGLLHALLGAPGVRELQGHTVADSS